MTNNYLEIYKVVRRIPRGRVATYGQIAELAGLDGHATPGRLRAARCSSFDEAAVAPRHQCSRRSQRTVAGDSHELQRHLLEAEGITFDERGRVDLRRYRWVKR